MGLQTHIQKLFNGQRQRMTDKQRDQKKNLCSLKEINKTSVNYFTCRYCDVEAFYLTSSEINTSIQQRRSIFSDSRNQILLNLRTNNEEIKIFDILVVNVFVNEKNAKIESRRWRVRVKEDKVSKKSTKKSHKVSFFKKNPKHKTSDLFRNFPSFNHHSLPRFSGERHRHHHRYPDHNDRRNSNEQRRRHRQNSEHRTKKNRRVNRRQTRWCLMILSVPIHYWIQRIPWRRQKDRVDYKKQTDPCSSLAYNTQKQLVRGHGLLFFLVSHIWTPDLILWLCVWFGKVMVKTLVLSKLLLLLIPFFGVSVCGEELWEKESDRTFFFSLYFNLVESNVTWRTRSCWLGSACHVPFSLAVQLKSLPFPANWQLESSVSIFFFFHSWAHLPKRTVL